MSEEAIQAEDAVIEEGNEINEEIEASEEVAVDAETTEELADEVEQAIEDGATEQEIKQMVQSFELKVNGKSYTKELDLNDHEAVKSELQKALAGQQAMQRSSELEKIYEQEVAKLKSDPFAVLEELGLDPDELAELRIQQRIEEMKKSPEQLAQDEMRKELEEARAKLKYQEETAEQAKFDKLQQEAAKSLDDEISTALGAHTTLAASPSIVKRVADTMLWAMTPIADGGGGYEGVTAEDVLPTVEAELKKDISSMMEQLPEEVMEAYIGSKNIERLRQKRLAKVKDTNNLSNKKEISKSKPEEREARKKVSLDAFMRKR
jgi:hypothetical protein